MIARRSFFKSLLVLPTALVIATETIITPEYRLPVDCDLSFTSFQYAYTYGQRHLKLGKCKKLIIGPELRFPAREILGDPRKPYTGDSEINVLMEDLITYSETTDIQYGVWILQFEKGSIKSGTTLGF